jgi:hypothetical protein
MLIHFFFQCLATTISMRTCLTMRAYRACLTMWAYGRIPDFPEEDIPACPVPSQPSRFPSSTGPPNHHAFHHPLAVQDPGQRTRVMPRLRTPCPGGTWPGRCARLVFQQSYAEIYTKTPKYI